MEIRNRAFFKFNVIILLAASATGCGVKGRPQAPLTPPPIGRGEPIESSVTKKKDIKNRYDLNKEQETETTE